MEAAIVWGMARLLPPLNPLRAFEAAARHSSFTRAAEELCVTSSAVGHQVKTLEDYLGVTLFVREAKSLALTVQGRSYLPSVQQAIDALVEGTRQLRAANKPDLRIDIPPTFAAKWLIPRLERFVRLNLGIDVKVSCSDTVVDFSRDEYDLAIRFGRGQYADMNTERCLEVRVFPVCSPSVVTAAKPLREPADLKHHMLLHDGSTYNDGKNPHWSDWLAFAKVRDVDASRGLSFRPTHLVINAALDGLGIALAKDVWVDDDIKAGRLIKPFDLSLPVELAYYVTYPGNRLGDERIRAFCEWLKSEAGISSRPTEHESFKSSGR
jgi:LysR family glycine cleavage system transcriptional activator